MWPLNDDFCGVHLCPSKRKISTSVLKMHFNISPFEFLNQILKLNLICVFKSGKAGALGWIRSTSIFLKAWKNSRGSICLTFLISLVEKDVFFYITQCAGYYMCYLGLLILLFYKSATLICILVGSWGNFLCWTDQ